MYSTKEIYITMRQYYGIQDYWNVYYNSSNCDVQHNGILLALN